jgi:sugar/nucleoside kinase (ribokinase family)
MLACALGDLLLDVVVRLEEPLAAGADAAARTTVLPGGQAANVCAWVVALGERARFIGKRGDDFGGRLAAAALATQGVELVGPVVPDGNGVVVSFVSPDGDRTMASDRGVAPDLQAPEIDPAWLDGCDHLHVAGYSLGREPIRGAAERAIGLARARGARVSVDLSASTVLERFGPVRFRELLKRLAPDVVFCNEDEQRAIGGPLAGSHWILKRGARGASFDGDERPATPVAKVVDATGAGDAFAAGWIVGGADLALEAAARCVSQVGASPFLVQLPDRGSVG